MAVAIAALGAIGWGAAPAQAVPQMTPASHDFGSVAIGNTSTPFAFTLRHTCTPQMGFPTYCNPETPFIANPNTTGDFVVISEDCPAVLPGPVFVGIEQACLINVAFRPTATGARSGQVRGDNTAFPSANLTGTGLPGPPAATPKKKCKKKKKKKSASAAKKCKKKKKK